MASAETRSFLVAGPATDYSSQGGSAAGCGVGIDATAVMINFVAVDPQGLGNLRGSAYPSPVPTTGSIIDYQALTPPLNIANGVIFPICDHSASLPCTYDINLYANGAGLHVVTDVLGYFTRSLPTIARATGLGPDDGTDTGRILSRTLSFSNKKARPPSGSRIPTLGGSSGRTKVADGKSG